MREGKVEWTRPQLIVLTRGTPDESVLSHCKYIGNANPNNPDSLSKDGCDKLAGGNCGVCQARSGS